MEKHFLVSECNGALYDTRKKDWHKLPPLRAIYSRLYSEIQDAQALRACIRERYALSYDTAFVTNCGACLCHACVKENYRNVSWSIRNKCSDGWRVSSLIIECETDRPVYCDNCGKNIFNIEENEGE